METHIHLLFPAYGSFSSKEKRLLNQIGGGAEAPKSEPAPNAETPVPQTEIEGVMSHLEASRQQSSSYQRQVEDARTKADQLEQSYNGKDVPFGDQEQVSQLRDQANQNEAAMKSEQDHQAFIEAGFGMGMTDAPEAGATPSPDVTPTPLSSTEAPQTDPRVAQPGDPDFMGPPEPETASEQEPKTLGESFDKMIKDNQKILNDPKAAPEARLMALGMIIATFFNKVSNISRLNEPLNGTLAPSMEQQPAASSEIAGNKPAEAKSGPEKASDDVTKVQNPEKEAEELKPKIEEDTKKEKDLEGKRVGVAKRLQDALVAQTADGDSTSAERGDIAKLTQELQDLDKQIDTVEKRIKENTDRKDALDKEQARRRELVEKNLQGPIVSRGIGVESVTLLGDSLVFKIQDAAFQKLSEQFRSQAGGPESGVQLEIDVSNKTIVIKNIPAEAWTEEGIKRIADSLVVTDAEKEADPAIEGTEAVGHEITNIENLLKVSRDEVTGSDMEKQNTQMEKLLVEANGALDKADSSKGVVRGQIVERLGLSDPGKEVADYRIVYDSKQDKIAVQPA